MSDLADVVQALLARRELGAAILIHMDVIGGPIRLWTGPYDKTIAGERWKGAGRLVSIDNIAPAVGTQAGKMTLRLSGVDSTITALAVTEINTIIGRDVTIFGQFFDTSHIAVGAPIAIGGGVADQLTFEGKGASERNINLTLEGPFVGRSRSPACYYSYSEQWDRAVAMGYETGDDGGKFMPALQNQTITFPDHIQ